MMSPISLNLLLIIGDWLPLIPLVEHQLLQWGEPASASIAIHDNDSIVHALLLGCPFLHTFFSIIILHHNVGTIYKNHFAT